MSSIKKIEIRYYFFFVFLLDLWCIYIILKVDIWSCNYVYILNNIFEDIFIYGCNVW